MRPLLVSTRILVMFRRKFHFFNIQRGIFHMQVDLNFLKIIGFKNASDGIYTCLLGQLFWEHNICVTESL
jgi:hypothetical protein